jgi:hypothetical protein
MLDFLPGSPCALRTGRKEKSFSAIAANSNAHRLAPAGSRSRRGVLPALECLEDRCLLTVAYPAALLFQPGGLPLSSTGLPAGFSPAQIRQAYGFNQIAFNNGTVKGDGTGQTIAIVDAYDQPNLASNLATFDSVFGIAAPPSFTKVNETGGAALPAASASWGLEESLDVEWAHAIAPGAKIVLVEASSSGFSDLLSAVNYARNLAGVSVVSMSWGAGEFAGENSYDSYFTTPAGHTGVTFVASSGDSGSAGAPEWPSISSNVLAVGGTQLTLNSNGNYQSESGWSGSGGGISLYESQPSFQKGTVTQSTTKRTVPDVSYDASGGSPFAVYDTSSYSGWLEVYGTSAGAPQWAGLIAIADQGRALTGQSSLNGPTQTLPAIYKLPAADFHDVTGGSNGGYSASTGYDLVTGRGTPVANLVVSGLVNGTNSPAPTPPTVVTAAHASASTVTGTTTGLSVLGSDAAGAASLTYTWSVFSAPAGVAAPGFSVNGSNAADNTTVTFHAAGTYTLLVTLKDPAGLTATSSVTVTVNQTETYLSLTPGTVTLIDGRTQQFTAKALDQFGTALARQPTWSWAVASGAGSVSSTGLYTAPASGTGASSVRATAGGLSVTATVEHMAATPAAPTNLTDRAVTSGWLLLSWTNNATNQSGVIIQRSTDGGAWTQVGAVAGNINFFDDTTTSRLHSYAYRVYAYNAAGSSAFSDTTASLRPAANAAASFVSAPAAAAPSQALLTEAAEFRAVAYLFGVDPAQVGNSAAVETRNSEPISDAFWQTWSN